MNNSIIVGIFTILSAALAMIGNNWQFNKRLEHESKQDFLNHSYDADAEIIRAIVMLGYDTTSLVENFPGTGLVSKKRFVPNSLNCTYGFISDFNELKSISEQFNAARKRMFEITAKGTIFIDQDMHNRISEWIEECSKVNHIFNEFYSDILNENEFNEAKDRFVKLVLTGDGFKNSNYEKQAVNILKQVKKVYYDENKLVEDIRSMVYK
ncbi:unnamed protein product [Fructobacillus fructosus]|uniref:hypothetical protein n=1 Tax=Fructobacillus fructosus TaxID=1631 RepID=UPI002DA59539|nr:unnamed protein product [Fructobacillus fructosus]